MRLLCLLIGAVVLLGACAPAPVVDVQTVQTQAAQTVIANLATPVPIAQPTLTCDPSPFLQASRSSIDQFDDSSKRASASPRISLSPVVGEMQDIRRTFTALVAPACAQRYQTLVGQAMEAEINGFLSFMKQDPDSTVQSKFSIAQKAWADAGLERLELNYLLGTPRPPTPVPTAPPPTADVSAYLQQVQLIGKDLLDGYAELGALEAERKSNPAAEKDTGWRTRVANLSQKLTTTAENVRTLPVPPNYADLHKELVEIADKFAGAGRKINTALSLNNFIYMSEALTDGANPNARLPLLLDKMKALQ